MPEDNHACKDAGTASAATPTINPVLTSAAGDVSSVCLSTAYLPSVDYVALWMHAGTVFLEKYEFVEKQSYRNRCRIASASGMMELSIPVERRDGNRTLIKDVRLANHGNWPHQHWKAIEAAYQSSPYFEYLADELETIYRRPGVLLWDFNERCMQFVASWLNDLNLPLATSSFESLPANTLVLRNIIHPKKPALFDELPPYYQVFSQRNGFLPNLSILDLMMNCGNEAILYLNNFKNRKFSVFL